MKILVIKRDKLGDLLLSTPLFEHLKASLPEAELHLLANDYNAWVVAGYPAIDRLWVYRRVRHCGRVSLSAALAWLWHARALRAQRFDWVIVANGDESPRAIRRGLAVRGARTIACCADAVRYPGLTDPITLQPAQHEADRNRHHVKDDEVFQRGGVHDDQREVRSRGNAERRPQPERDGERRHAQCRGNRHRRAR